MTTPATPFALAPPECITDQGSWCAQVWKLTHNEWLAASATWLVAKPLRILLILLIALLVRFLARRVVDRLARSAGGKSPTLLRPLRERSPESNSMLTERRTQRAQTIASVLRSVVSFLVYGLAVILILGELGINLGPIVASAGIVGIALGFGAQNLVRDFLSGMFMMIEDQYGVGDWVDVGEASGTVEAVGLRVTTLRDMGGTVWYVRNGEILRVGNSSQGFATAVVDVPLGYGTDVGEATDILVRVCEQATSTEPLASDVLEPPEVLGVETVGVEGITMRLTVKVRAGRQWATQRLLRGKIMTAFEDAGIRPPLGRWFPATET